MDASDEIRTETDPVPDQRPASERTTVDFAHPDTLVGQHLDGRFLIAKNLTETGADAGGIGLVYLARDTKLLNKQVVVKILQETALQHSDIVRKFQHEKEALIRLDHPGIVRILDSGTLLDGNPFMVMDFIEGHSLRKLLKDKRPLPLQLAAHLIEAITDALGAAHSEKILHRDIKPENIMLTAQEDGPERVRLIDFGIARVDESELAPQTEVGRPIGTVLYMAPEQLIGRLDLKPSADIYATAIVAYEMITGELPFKPRNISEMYQLEREGVRVAPRQLRPDLPVKAEALLLQALEFEPEKRPQNIRAFGRELAKALTSSHSRSTVDEDGSTIKTELFVPARPTDPTRLVDEPVVVPPRRRLVWPAIGLAALAAVFISAAFFAFYRTGTNDPSSTGTAGPAGSEGSLSYYLKVQKMRNGKAYQEPFRSSGQEVFESGYKFNLLFASDAAGYMYAFSEGKDVSGKTVHNLLFPTPSINNGSSKVNKLQEIETRQNTFEGGTGTEVIWLIWTAQERADLETIVKAAFDNRGLIADSDGLKTFIDKYKSATAGVSKDQANQKTIVKATGDAVAHRIELEHR